MSAAPRRPLNGTLPPTLSSRHAPDGKGAHQPTHRPQNSDRITPYANPPPPGHRPTEQSIPSTVQHILQMGADRNMQASQMSALSVSANGPRHAPAGPSYVSPTLKQLDKAIEETWVAAGRAAEVIGDWRRALSAYETALRHSPFNTDALTQTANILRQQEKFVEAAEYFTRVVNLEEDAGEVWGALGHCYLMIDDLPKAYACYQQAIMYIPDAKNEPKLWYGIGILYDRYGSLEHAEEAFASVINTDPNFEKANEIYFRLGIIYKQQKNSASSLSCFKYILHNPPRPLTEVDIWFQIGHVYEQQQDFEAAKDAYERVLSANPTHAKVLQQLGGLYHRRRAPFFDAEKSVAILTKSLEHDATDPFSWYLLGRAYMKGGNYGKAYEAYQQAVYRDGKNPAFWCSIGLLYYQINQFHDALDAYSRAIKINPYIAEVWHNLGALYESCNDQTNDAIDAYNRCLHLDPGDEVIRLRLEKMRSSMANSRPISPPPAPRDISPQSDSWVLAATSAQSPQSPVPAVAAAFPRPTNFPEHSRPPSRTRAVEDGRHSPVNSMRGTPGPSANPNPPTNGKTTAIPSMKTDLRTMHAPEHAHQKSAHMLSLSDSRRPSFSARPGGQNPDGNYDNPPSPRSNSREFPSNGGSHEEHSRGWAGPAYRDRPYPPPTERRQSPTAPNPARRYEPPLSHQDPTVASSVRRVSQEPPLSPLRRSNPSSSQPRPINVPLSKPPVPISNPKRPYPSMQPLSRGKGRIIHNGPGMPPLPISGNYASHRMPSMPSPSGPAHLRAPQPTRVIDEKYDEDNATDGLMALASAAAPSPAVTNTSRPASGAEQSRKRSLGEVSNTSDPAENARKKAARTSPDALQIVPSPKEPSQTDSEMQISASASPKQVEATGQA